MAQEEKRQEEKGDLSQTKKQLSKMAPRKNQHQTKRRRKDVN